MCDTGAMSSFSNKAANLSNVHESNPRIMPGQVQPTHVPPFGQTNKTTTNGLTLDLRQDITNAIVVVIT